MPAMPNVGAALSIIGPDWPGGATCTDPTGLPHFLHCRSEHVRGSNSKAILPVGGQSDAERAAWSLAVGVLDLQAQASAGPCPPLRTGASSGAIARATRKTMHSCSQGGRPFERRFHLDHVNLSCHHYVMFLRTLALI